MLHKGEQYDLYQLFTVISGATCFAFLLYKIFLQVDMGHDFTERRYRIIYFEIFSKSTGNFSCFICNSPYFMAVLWSLTYRNIVSTLFSMPTEESTISS